MRQADIFRKRFAIFPLWVEKAFFLLAGAGGALAQAPFDIAPFIFVPLIAGFAAHQRSASLWQGALAGWLIGVGYFMVTLRWIVEPFQVDAAAHGWMAPFALILLAALLALFWSAAFALSRWLRPQPWPLILTWSGAELLRGYLFTGFPWANPAQSILDTPVEPLLALIGPYGVTVLLCLGAWIVVHVWRRRRGWAIGLAAGVLLMLAYDPPKRNAVNETPHVIRIVQPNMAQSQKWQAENIDAFMRRQLDLTRGAKVDLVIWPEVSIPYLTSRAGPFFAQVMQASGGAPVLLGALRDDARGRIYNSAVLIGSGGTIEAHYDKHHLVPFGEYMPFPAFFRGIGIRALAQRTEWGYARGPGPRVMDLGPLGSALPLICYEAVFPQDLRTGTRPSFLVQLTNDAWFGQGAGPLQHLAQARMRAIEQGLPLVRAANTGVSAMIGPDGRVLQSLSLSQAGQIDAALPEPKSATLYAQSGDRPLAIFLALAMVLAGAGSMMHSGRIPSFGQR